MLDIIIIIIIIIIINTEIRDTGCICACCTVA